MKYSIDDCKYKSFLKVGPLLLQEGYTSAYSWLVDRSVHIPWEQGRARMMRMANGSAAKTSLSVVGIAMVLFNVLFL